MDTSAPAGIARNGISSRQKELPEMNAGCSLLRKRFQITFSLDFLHPLDQPTAAVNRTCASPVPRKRQLIQASIRQMSHRGSLPNAEHVVWLVQRRERPVGINLASALRHPTGKRRGRMFKTDHRLTTRGRTQKKLLEVREINDRLHEKQKRLGSAGGSYEKKPIV